jgi:hypothetical protein
MSSNDFGADFAAELAAYFTGGTDVTAPPATVYITLYDDTGTELNADLQNGRVGVSPGADFQQGADATQFENAVEVDFGEVTASSNITVQEFAIKDSDADDATALEYYRSDITDAPQEYAPNTRVFFEAGGLSVNVLDRTND